VLTFSEARHHPHHVARKLFGDGDLGGVRSTPQFDRTPGEPGPSPTWPGADTDAVLLEAGFSSAEIERLRAVGGVR
jgi:alpha-methylacyl-CoA racemase